MKWILHSLHDSDDSLWLSVCLSWGSGFCSMMMSHSCTSTVKSLFLKCELKEIPYKFNVDRVFLISDILSLSDNNLLFYTNVKDWQPVHGVLCHSPDGGWVRVQMNAKVQGFPANFQCNEMINVINFPFYGFNVGHDLSVRRRLKLCTAKLDNILHSAK